MAFNPSKLILSLLFVVATAASVAHNNPIVAQVSVVGQMVCIVPGTNCTTCPGIAGVKVTLSCNGGRTTLAQAITNNRGVVNLTLSAANVGVFDQSQCFVYVKLPVATCHVFSRTGTLRSPVIFVNFVQEATRLMINFTFGVFRYVN
ncbi:hypothetical protein CsSME_00045871 [Camellia sinensis var. sinensis]|uniref:uncharacterized protein LOC114271488 n=1 Tax=Camellia sinensis TaxID=4442 RepID=UPI001035958F|nr:uncharacterized protein LOC114271488 [Camellia sinensis]